MDDTELARLHQAVQADPADTEARLALLTTLRDTILMTGGDISEIAPDDTRQA